MSNPLQKYFRQPAIFYKLPSDGKFWKDGDLNMPVNHELPIYPMTTKDEVTLKTPDALMNGAGVVSVIQSCCPSIINAWHMPSIDVDAILIAIRIASFGHEMEFETKCPHCNEDNNHNLDLRVLLDNIKCPDYSGKIESGELKFKLRPQPYFGSDRGNAIRFEEQKLMQALEKIKIEPEVRAAEIEASMTRLFKLGLNTLVDSTEYIEMNDGTIISNPEHISEFLANSSSQITKMLQDQLSSYASLAGLRPLEVVCTECTKSYAIPLEFDYGNFFAKGS